MTLAGSDNSYFLWPVHYLVLEIRAGSGGESKSSFCFGGCSCCSGSKGSVCATHEYVSQSLPLMMQLVESPSEL